MDEGNSDADDAADEATKKLSAEWAIELDTALKCDRKGDAICQYGKCWKEGNPDDLEQAPKHHPINPRDSSFWLLSLVSQAINIQFVYLLMWNTYRVWVNGRA